MKTIFDHLSVFLGILGTFIGSILGGFDGFLYTLLGFILMDYFTGLIIALIQKKLSSEIGFIGILKKVLMLMMVAMAHLLDLHLLGGGNAMRTGVIFFYIANEGISITENLSRIGFPIPEKLKNCLLQLSQEKKEKN
jgi:toxin secretion/phage lysis holin